MKRNNFLFKITDNKTGESRWFTKDSIVMSWIGCSLTSMPFVKANNSPKYDYITYEIADGSNVLYKDINNVN